MKMPVMTAQRRELSRLVGILPDDQVQATLDYVLQRFDAPPSEDMEEYTLAAEAYAKHYHIKYIIDDTAPKLNLSITPSNNNDNKIIATISSNEELQELEGWIISKDKKSMTKTYDSEPDEKVTIKDLVGNEVIIAVKIKGNGDMNNDNKITATDLIIMKRKIVKIVQTTAEDIKNGDLNGDGKITATDLLLLKKVIVGLV